MGVEYIVQRLNNCAAGECSNCKHNKFYDLSICQNELIKEMGEECRKIAAESEDDLK